MNRSADPSASTDDISIDRLRFRVAECDGAPAWVGVRYATRDTDGEVWAEFSGGGVRHGNGVGTRDGSLLSTRSTFVGADASLGSTSSSARIFFGPSGGVEIAETFTAEADGALTTSAASALAGSGTRKLEQIGLDGVLLFICTGNFYRSRFAEHYFEHCCEAHGVDWIAESRGLRGWDTGARGRMSPATVDKLRELGVPVPYVIRSPHLATPTDIEAATRIIALDGREHRPLVRQWLAKFEERIEYWDVPDVDRVDPSVALPAIVEQVDHLVAELVSQHATRRSSE